MIHLLVVGGDIIFIDPYSEVRVSDIHGNKVYYFWHPNKSHEEVLKSNGWSVSGDGYFTVDEAIAKNTLDSLNLPMPFDKKHCYRVWWRDFNYCI